MVISGDNLIQLISPKFSMLDESSQREIYRYFYYMNYNMVFFMVQDHDAVQDHYSRLQSSESLDQGDYSKFGI